MAKRGKSACAPANERCVAIIPSPRMKNPFFEVITTNIWPAGRQPFSEWAVTRAKRSAEEENQKESQRDWRVRKRDERREGERAEKEIR